MSMNELDFDTTGMTWRERLPHIVQVDFSPEELKEIGHDAAMDLLTNSQIQALIILFTQIRIIP